MLKRCAKRFGLTPKATPSWLLLWYHFPHMTIRTLAFCVFLLALITGAFFFVSGGMGLGWQTGNHTIYTGTSTSIVQNTDDYAGIISTNASGQRVYTNDRYSFQFTYPANWETGDNTLGAQNGGTLQFFNSSRQGAGQSHGFATGENKIEIAVINTASSSAILSSSSPDYPTKSLQSISLSISGESVSGANVELIGGEKFRMYRVPLQATPDKSLLLTIYGDASNFYMLDALVKNITWTR